MATRGSAHGWVLAGTLTAFAVAGLKAEAADWPGWRGENRDGKSGDKGLLKSWPQGGPKLLWKATGIGKGFSSVAVAGGAVYTTGHKDGNLHLAALGEDGKLKWSKQVETGFVNNHPGSRSTPVVDGGLVYVESDLGQVICGDAATGSVKWTRKLAEFGGKPPAWGFSESVLIAGDLAVVTPGGANCLAALNKKTGATVWTSEPFGQAQYCSPLFAQFKGVGMIVNGTRDGLIAVNAKTGKTLWKNGFCAGNTANCPTPAYSDGYVFWANGYGKGGLCLKLGLQGAGVTATQAWTTGDMVCHHGGYVIHDGYVYGNNGGGWACLDLKTGATKWQAPAVGKGSVCFADGMLYLFSENGGRAAIGPASPDGFKVTGEVAVQGSGPSWAHPAVANGRLYLRYDDNLYAYDVSGKP